jgi:hypothetical protein
LFLERRQITEVSKLGETPRSPKVGYCALRNRASESRYRLRIYERYRRCIYSRRSPHVGIKRSPPPSRFGAERIGPPYRSGAKFAIYIDKFWWRGRGRYAFRICY